MKLIYRSYMQENTEYTNWLEKLINEDFESDAPPIIKMRLKEVRENFEQLMEKCNELEVASEDEDNLKDLKYLLIDSLFLAMDLQGFFEVGELGRFKMRVLNYLNKKRRAEVFGELSQANCRVNQ